LNRKFLEDFFITSLDESARYQNLNLPNFVKLYLVALLVGLAVSENNKKYDLSKKLFDLYIEASSSRNNFYRIEKLKSIGDISMIKLGFFPESISKKIVGPSYYRDMGTSAYYTVFQNNKKIVYRDLSDLYDLCIDVLHGVKNMANNDDIVELYEFWNVTDSRFAKRRLTQLGFTFNKRFLA